MLENDLEISCQQTYQVLHGKKPPVLIDCREQHEWDFCRIEGAVLVPLSEFAGKAEKVFQDPEQEAVIYCHHGVRSLHAVQYLRQQGFQNTLSMQGGIDAWSNQIDPNLEKY